MLHCAVLPNTAGSAAIQQKKRVVEAIQQYSVYSTIQHDTAIQQYSLYSIQDYMYIQYTTPELWMELHDTGHEVTMGDRATCTSTLERKVTVYSLQKERSKAGGCASPHRCTPRTQLRGHVQNVGRSVPWVCGHTRVKAGCPDSCVHVPPMQVCMRGSVRERDGPTASPLLRPHATYMCM